MSDAQANRCDFTGPPSSGPGSVACDLPARERTVVDERGETAQVALCDEHYDYVSDAAHAHYWYIHHPADGTRTLIRMARPKH